MESYCLTGTEFLFGMMTKFRKWIVMMVVQHCECTVTNGKFYVYLKTIQKNKRLREATR